MDINYLNKCIENVSILERIYYIFAKIFLIYFGYKLNIRLVSGIRIFYKIAIRFWPDLKKYQSGTSLREIWVKHGWGGGFSIKIKKTFVKAK